MKRVGHMMTLITSGLAILACQGCSSHLGGMDRSVVAAAASNGGEVSEGMKLATEGAFRSNIDVGVHPYNTQIPGQPVTLVPPPAATGMAAIAGDEAFAIDWPVFARAGNAGEQFSDLSWSNSEPLRAIEGNLEAARLTGAVDRDKDFSAEFEFGASREETGLAFDIGVAPRLSFREEGQFRSRSLGAQLRIGRDFDQRGTSAVADSWYVFAGAEGEALVWEAGEYGLSNVSGAVALRDQVTVGDMQAGVSFQRGPGQLSLSYIRREVEFNDRNGGASEDEDFAGVSFTLRK